MTASESMVERVARAIDEADVGYSVKLTRLVDDVHTYTLWVGAQKIGEFDDIEAAYEVCRPLRMYAKARAAIEAMRKPTEAMQHAGFRNNRHANANPCDRPTCIGRVTMPADKAWRAMVTAALEEDRPEGPAR